MKKSSPALTDRPCEGRAKSVDTPATARCGWPSHASPHSSGAEGLCEGVVLV